jgi:anion-transporting  ArsA/GET3 family ATPase
VCAFFRRKVDTQARYLEQIIEAYGDQFSILEVPLVPGEVRGREAILQFAEALAPLFVR